MIHLRADAEHANLVAATQHQDTVDEACRSLHLHEGGASQRTRCQRCCIQRERQDERVPLTVLLQRKFKELTGMTPQQYV